MPQPTGLVKQEALGGYVEHPYLYFPDGNMTLKAENPEQLFKIHGYLFERESDESRALLAQLNEEPVGIIELVGVDSAELEDFLRLLYTPPLQEPVIKSRSEWTHVLKLSTMWNFATFRSHAISRLPTLIPTSTQRLLLAHQYDVDEWLRDSYLRLCEHHELPNDKNIEKLGHAVFVKMVRARERLAKQKDSLGRPEKIEIIEEIFGLPHIPYVDDPLRPPKPETSVEVVNDPASVSSKSKKRPRPVSLAGGEMGDDSLSQPVAPIPETSAPGVKKQKSIPSSASVNTKPSYHSSTGAIKHFHQREVEQWPDYEVGEQPHYTHPTSARGRGTGQGRGRARAAGRGRGSEHVHPLPSTPIATPSNPTPDTQRGGSINRGRGRNRVRGGSRAQPY